MKTKQLKSLLQEQFNKMTDGASHLFEVNVDKETAWNTYLESFPEGHNKIYLERREFDCNACSLFIKTVSNVVSIKDGKVMSVWDIDTECDTYAPVVDAMKNLIHNSTVKGIFYYDSKEMSFGQESNKVLLEDGTIKTWEHLYIPVPKKFQRTRGDSSATVRGKYNSIKQVFQRGLSELTVEALEVTLELINQGSLYKGDEWKNIVIGFLDIKKQYDKLSSNEAELFIWEKSVTLTGSLTGLRNTSMGTLLVDISSGESLDSAVRKYEKIVAPTNYKRTKGLFSEKMKQDAQQFLIENGYGDSLVRRYATLDDITVNNILFSNKDSAQRVENAMDVFSSLSATAPKTPKKFSNVSEITIEEFVKNVLPTTTSVEAYVENKHIKNFVSLIAPVNPDAKSMFKWSNGFSLGYTGNMTDSALTEQVRNAGGSVDGVLRFSHSWNHEGMRNASLMDLHVFLPKSNQSINMRDEKEIHDNYGNDNRVGWNKRKHMTSGGVQDVDYVEAAPSNYVPVENITFPSMNNLEEGVYTFKIHNWKLRTPTHGGFKAEIAFGGQVYEFERAEPLANKEWVTLAKIELKNGQFTILEMMGNSVSTKEVWGIKTNEFVPVTVAMHSPNYWDEQEGIGHKHYMFMLDGCVNTESPNAFFNEFLKEEFSKHRQVMEVLGGKLSVADADDQLSGLGFSSTQRNELLVKVTGQTERLLKIKF